MAQASRLRQRGESLSMLIAILEKTNDNRLIPHYKLHLENLKKNMENSRLILQLARLREQKELEQQSQTQAFKEEMGNYRIAMIAISVLALAIIVFLSLWVRMLRTQIKKPID